VQGSIVSYKAEKDPSPLPLSTALLMGMLLLADPAALICCFLANHHIVKIYERITISKKGTIKNCAIINDPTSAAKDKEQYIQGREIEKLNKI
jgi:hypothetical protein